MVIWCCLNDLLWFEDVWSGSLYSNVEPLSAKQYRDYIVVCKVSVSCSGAGLCPEHSRAREPGFELAGSLWDWKKTGTCGFSWTSKIFWQQKEGSNVSELRFTSSLLIPAIHSATSLILRPTFLPVRHVRLCVCHSRSCGRELSSYKRQLHIVRAPTAWWKSRQHIFCQEIWPRAAEIWSTANPHIPEEDIIRWVFLMFFVRKCVSNLGSRTVDKAQQKSKEVKTAFKATVYPASRHEESRGVWGVYGRYWLMAWQAQTGDILFPFAWPLAMECHGLLCSGFTIPCLWRTWWKRPVPPDATTRCCALSHIISCWMCCQARLESARECLSEWPATHVTQMFLW